MIQRLPVMKLWSHTTKKQNLYQQILMKKKATCKTQNLSNLFAFLLLIIALLIAVSIYCYLIEYRAKQKHLFPFHVTNNELKETMRY